MDKRVLGILRGFYTGQMDAIDKLAPKLPEDMRAQLKPIRDQIATVLAKAPDSGKDGDDDSLPTIDLAGFNTNFIGLIDTMSTKISDQATQLASLDSKVTAAIDAKIAAGELITKDKATELQSAAVKAEQAKFALASDRRANLVKASLPTPANEDVLVASDDVFNKTLGTAKDRVKKITDKGVVLAAAALSDLAWTTDADFESKIGLIDQVRAAVPGKKAEPLATGGPAGEKRIWV